MPTIVFASDSHLNKHYARMTPDQLGERRARLRAGMQQTIDFAIAEKADLYLHGGDLFDGPNPRAVEMIWAARQFRRLAEAGVASFLIGGNHDIPRSRHGGVTPQRLFAEMGVAHVFNDPTRVTWSVVDVEGVRIAVGGLPPDPRLGPDDDPLTRLSEPLRPPEADLRVLLTHYALEGRLHPLAMEATIREASVTKLAGLVDWLLIGHIHQADQLELGGVRVLFPGPTERMSFGEMDVRCGFARLAVARSHGQVHVQARHVHIDPQPMRREVVRAGDIPADAPTDWLIERVRSVAAPDQILQLSLEGPLPRETYHRLRIRELWSVGDELSFFFDLDRRRLTVRDPSAVAARAGTGQRVSPRAEITRVAKALDADAEGQEERSAIEAARRMVLERYAANVVEEEG